MKRRSLTGLSLVLLLLAGAQSTAWAGAPRPATPDQIKELIKSAGDADKYDDASVVYLLDEADVYVQKSGLATTKSCQVIKILTDEGVKRYSVYREEFDPVANRVAIDSVRVYRSGGQTEDVPLSTIITQPTKQHMIYWGGKQHLLNIPRLEVGDCVEIRTSRVGFNIAYLADDESGSQLSSEGLIPPMIGHWYEVTRFETNDPIVKKRYAVHLPKDMPIQYEVYNGELKNSVWFDGDNTVYTFTDEDIPAFKSEPHMASRDDYVTKVVMATVADWETKSRWFHGVNESQFEADDAIKAKVAEITQGLTDEESKIEACLHWVSDNIRYYGTSRGPAEGYTLHTGIETFHDRGGVCKDIAGMLITMLRVLGHESYPALTMAGPRVEEIPADQFNHTVTVMRNKDGSFRVLDPTWSPFSNELWSSREALQGLVYGTPEGQDLTLSPYFPPEYNSVRINSNATIGTDGTLHTKLVLDMKGYACTYFRRNLHRYQEPRIHAAFEEAMMIAPSARLNQFEHTAVQDYSRDSQAKLDISADNYTAGAGDIRLLRLPLMSHPFGKWLIPDLFWPVSDKDRDHGMRMRATRLVQYSDTIKLPNGWKVERLPDAKHMDSGSASLDFHAEADGNEITYRFELSVKNHIIPAADYPDYKKAIEMMKEIEDELVVCRISEGK